MAGIYYEGIMTWFTVILVCDTLGSDYKIDLLWGMYSSVGEFSLDLWDRNLLPLLLGLDCFNWSVGLAPKLSFKWLPLEVMPMVRGSSIWYLGDSIIGRNSSMSSPSYMRGEEGLLAEPCPKVCLGPESSVRGTDCLLFLWAPASLTWDRSMIGMIGSDGYLFIGLN